MDNQALTPDTPILNIEPEQVEELAIEQAIEGDKELASLTGSTGWEKITKEMKFDIDQLRNMKGVDIVGKDLAVVGQKFLVASLVADHLQSYLDKVENAAKAVADDARRKQPK